MGPHLGFTDDNISLLHAELYDSAWVNETFPSGKDWEAVLTAAAGKNFDIFYSYVGMRAYSCAAVLIAD